MKEEVSGHSTPHTCHRRLYCGAGATAGGRPHPGTGQAVTHSNQYRVRVFCNKQGWGGWGGSGQAGDTYQSTGSHIFGNRKGQVGWEVHGL